MYSIGSNCIYNVYRSIPEYLKEKALKESIFRIIGTVVITVIFGITSKMLGIPLDIFILTLVVGIMCDNEFRYRKNEKNK